MTLVEPWGSSPRRGDGDYKFSDHSWKFLCVEFRFGEWVWDLFVERDG
jgi:hypothetical protein